MNDIDLKDRKRLWFSGRLDKGKVTKAPSPGNGFFLTSDPEYAQHYVGNEGCCIVVQLSEKLRPFDFRKSSDIAKLNYPKAIAGMLFKGDFPKDGHYQNSVITSDGFWAWTQCVADGLAEELRSLRLKSKDVFKAGFNDRVLSEEGRWLLKKFGRVMSQKMRDSFDRDGTFVADGRESVYALQKAVCEDMLKQGFNCYYSVGDDGLESFDELVIFSREAFRSVLPIEISGEMLSELISSMKDYQEEIADGTLAVKDILIAMTGSCDIDASGDYLDRRRKEYHGADEIESRSLDEDDLECYYPDEVIPFSAVNFREYGIEVPRFMYHVSVEANRDPIAKDGIQPMSQEKKLWKGCDDHFTYWSRTLEEAVRFVGDLKKSDKLLCYRAELKSFQMSKLFVDRMLMSNFDEWAVPVTFEYHGGISAEKLQLMSREEALKQLRDEEDSEKLYAYLDLD